MDFSRVVGCGRLGWCASDYHGGDGRPDAWCVLRKLLGGIFRGGGEGGGATEVVTGCSCTTTRTRVAATQVNRRLWPYLLAVMADDNGCPWFAGSVF